MERGEMRVSLRAFIMPPAISALDRFSLLRNRRK